VLTRAHENVAENHDIRFEAPFTLRLIGAGGEVQAHHPKILIWRKSGQNHLKSGQNLWKIGQNA